MVNRISWFCFSLERVCSLVSTKHKRKDSYWLYYHLAHTLERDTVIENIVYLVKENPPPACSKNASSSSSSRRGRKPVHSWEKLVCICILMVIFGLTYRDMQNTVPSLNLPWNNDEPYPDHTWIARTFKKIPLKYLEDILTRSASICVCKNQDLRKKDYCCWLQIAPV